VGATSGDVMKERPDLKGRREPLPLAQRGAVRISRWVRRGDLPSTSIRGRTWTLLAAALAVWLPALPLRAQKLTQRVESRLGLGSLSMREDLLVPYAFTGPALAFGAGYGLMKGAHGLDLSLDFGMAPAWTRAGDPGLHARYALGAAYNVLIYARARRSSWLGAVARFNHELASLVSWDDAHGYWLDALMVGPALRHTEQPWPGLALELQTEVGLLGLSSRPPARRLNKQDALTKVRYHFNRLAQQPEVAWLGNTTLLRAEAVLRWRAREQAWGNGAGVGLETRLARASDPQPLTLWYVGVLGSYGRSWP
jgi:hypothetical protein